MAKNKRTDNAQPVLDALAEGFELVRNALAEQLIGKYVVTNCYMMNGFIGRSMTLRVIGYYPYRVERVVSYDGKTIVCEAAVHDELKVEKWKGGGDKEGKPLGEGTFMFELDLKDHRIFVDPAEAVALCHSRNWGGRDIKKLPMAHPNAMSAKKFY